MTFPCVAVPHFIFIYIYFYPLIYPRVATFLAITPGAARWIHAHVFVWARVLSLLGGRLRVGPRGHVIAACLFESAGFVSQSS